MCSKLDPPLHGAAAVLVAVEAEAVAEELVPDTTLGS